MTGLFRFVSQTQVPESRLWWHRAYDDERGSLKALGFGDPLKQPRPKAEMSQDVETSHIGATLVAAQVWWSFSQDFPSSIGSRI